MDQQSPCLIKPKEFLCRKEPSIVSKAGTGCSSVDKALTCDKKIWVWLCPGPPVLICKTRDVFHVFQSVRFFLSFTSCLLMWRAESSQVLKGTDTCLFNIWTWWRWERSSSSKTSCLGKPCLGPILIMMSAKQWYLREEGFTVAERLSWSGWLHQHGLSRVHGTRTLCHIENVLLGNWLCSLDSEPSYLQLYWNISKSSTSWIITPDIKYLLKWLQPPGFCILFTQCPFSITFRYKANTGTDHNFLGKE